MKRVLVFILLIILLNSQLLSQRIGINDDGSSPDGSAVVDIKSTTKGFLLPRLTTTQRVLMLDPADGLLVYDSTQHRIYNYVNGTGWRSFITGSYWQYFTGTLYNSAQNIGIGISTAQEKLHVTDGNFKISNGELTLFRSSGLLQKINFDYTGSSPNGFTEGVDFYIGGGSRKGYINYTESTSSGEDALKFYPSVSGAHSLTITSGGEFRWNGTIDPTIQLQDGGVNTGFMQVYGDDFRMGTNSGNAVGKIVVRTANTDRVFITSSGRVGIGESVPSQELHVAGGMYATGNVEVTTKVTADNLDFEGKLTKPSVSNSALTPLCYGSVNEDGSVRSVTPNVTITRVSTGTYTIDCAGIDDNCVILVTVATERYVGNGHSTLPNRAYVSIFYDSSTAPPPHRDSDFCFVIYKK